MMLFTLCFFQMMMASFFYAKENKVAAKYTFWVLMMTFAWLLLSIRQPPPVATDIKYGDENRAVVDGESCRQPPVHILPPCAATCGPVVVSAVSAV